MIWESYYWKQPLLRSATWLDRVTIPTEAGDSEKILARIERTILISFFSIRRLIEAHKLSLATINSQHIITYYKTAKRVDLFNWHKIGDLFQLENEHHEALDLPSLCNQFIHSFVFAISLSEVDQFSGCYVCSDRKRSSKLYHVSKMDILQIFRTVGHDYPASQMFRRSESTGQWNEIEPI